MADYYMALAEVNEVLKHIESWYIEKIPKEILELIRNNKENNIEFKYDVKKTLLEQNIHDETLELLEYINYNYWSNKSEKQELDKVYKENFKKLESQKKYDSDNLFKKSKNAPEQIQHLPKVAKEKNSFLKKIFNIIKAFIN